MAVHRPDGELHFFEQQTKESRRQLEDSKQRLLQFTTSHKVISAAAGTRLGAAEVERSSTSARGKRESKSRRRSRECGNWSSRFQVPERTTTLVRTADNPELLRPESELLDLQLKRTQLLTKFEPSHRWCRKWTSKLPRRNTTIVARTVSPVRDETTDKEPHFEWATSELQRAQVQLKALQSRAAAADSQAGSYRRWRRSSEPTLLRRTI